MNRIAAVLAATAAAFLILSIATGSCLLFGNVWQPDDPVVKYLSFHRLAGVAAGVVVLLADSVVVTYFIGTSRWIREVSDTYRLEPHFADRSARLKWRAFPASLTSMLTVLAIATLGAVADPMASVRLSPPAGMSWGMVHLTAACMGIALMAACFVIQRREIITNQSIIAAVVAEVQKIRKERGLA